MQNIRRMAALLVLLLVAALLTAMVWKPTPPAKFIGIKTQDVPRAVDGFSAPTDYVMPPEVLTALASADIVSRSYARGGDSIDFVAIGGTDRNALHDPRSCLVGAGWRLADDHAESLPGTSITVHDCHAVGQPDSPGLDIIYLYVVNGKVINQVTDIRTAMLWSALLGRKNTPVYFLRFTKPLADNPAQQAADHAELKQFTAKMWTALEPKLVQKVSS